jgi:hypothetical protein
MVEAVDSMDPATVVSGIVFSWSFDYGVALNACAKYRRRQVDGQLGVRKSQPEWVGEAEKWGDHGVATYPSRRSSPRATPDRKRHRKRRLIWRQRFREGWGTRAAHDQ